MLYTRYTMDETQDPRNLYSGRSMVWLKHPAHEQRHSCPSMFDLSLASEHERDSEERPSQWSQEVVKRSCGIL